MTLLQMARRPWWSHPDTRTAYYANLRYNSNLPALEAWEILKRAFSEYPEFMNSPMETLKNATQGKL